MSSMTDLEHDVRLLHRSLAKGFISREQLTEKLSVLPDMAEQADWFEVEVTEGATRRSATARSESESESESESDD